MKTKYLTIRAELVETGERDCGLCVFGILNYSVGFVCGLKYASVREKAYKECNKGCYKNIEL